MGTRAVVHVDLQPFGIGKDIWIATHWDGDPDWLGKSLKNAIKAEIKLAKKQYAHDWKSFKNSAMGSALSKAIWKGAADHSIDFSTTDGKAEFDKMYGDYAEYEYEITKTGKIKYREREGSWGEKTVRKWEYFDASGKKTKDIRKSVTSKMVGRRPVKLGQWKWLK